MLLGYYILIDFIIEIIFFLFVFLCSVCSVKKQKH